MMCGLAGYAGIEPGNIPEELMIEASKRGPHGYSIRSEKCALKDSGAYQRGKVEEVSGRIVMGHCRMATDGHYDDWARLHPLPIDSLAVCHNGVIDGFEAITSEQTDTERFIRSIEYRDIADLAVQIQEKIDNHYAFAITDWKCVFLLRKELPLYYRMTKDTLLWCSRQFERSAPINNGIVWSIPDETTENL